METLYVAGVQRQRVLGTSGSTSSHHRPGHADPQHHPATGTKPLPKIDSPTTSLEARRYWRRFQQLMELPEKDQRAVFRLLDTMSKARPPVKGKASVA